MQHVPGGGDYKMNKIRFLLQVLQISYHSYCKENLFILLATNIWASSTEREEEGEWIEEQTSNKTSTIKP